MNYFQKLINALLLVEFTLIVFFAFLVLVLLVLLVRIALPIVLLLIDFMLVCLLLDHHFLVMLDLLLGYSEFFLEISLSSSLSFFLPPSFSFCLPCPSWFSSPTSHVLYICLTSSSWCIFFSWFYFLFLFPLSFLSNPMFHLVLQTFALFFSFLLGTDNWEVCSTQYFLSRLFFCKWTRKTNHICPHRLGVKYFQEMTLAFLERS